MTTPELLTAYETCQKKGALASIWRREKLTTVETLRESLYRVLTAKDTQEPTFGDMAGSEVMEIASSPGIETDTPDKYACAMNLACLSDLLVTSLRKKNDPAWMVPEPLQNWKSACLMSPEGDVLRRLLLVSHWNDDRHYSECRSWFTLGEIAAYNLPMQMIVLVIGHERNGRRHSHWTKALRHTIGRTNIRFQRRVGNTSGGFKDSWTEIWREDHDEIDREMWLNAMLKDDVLQKLCFRVDVPVLSPVNRQWILDLADSKLDAMSRDDRKPLLNLSTCDWPVPCQFRKACHSIPEKEPSRAMGFVQIESSTPDLPVSIHR